MVKVLVDFEFLEALFMSTKTLLNEGNPVGLKVLHFIIKKSTNVMRFSFHSNLFVLYFSI